MSGMTSSHVDVAVLVNAIEMINKTREYLAETIYTFIHKENFGVRVMLLGQGWLA